MQHILQDAIVFIGVAQEKAQAFNGKKVNGHFQFNRDKTVYVNHYYFYIEDEEFGPLFLKICSYAPWSVKLCLNGHEWAKRQLDKRHITFEALDNGFLSCSEPVKLQRMCCNYGFSPVAFWYNIAETPVNKGFQIKQIGIILFG